MQMMFPQQFTKRKTRCLWIHIRATVFSAVTPRSDGKLLLVSRSTACLEGTRGLPQSPPAPRFVSRRVAACSSSSRDPFLYPFTDQTDSACRLVALRSIRVGCWVWKLSYPADPRNTDRPSNESLRKNYSSLGKANMLKVDCGIFDTGTNWFHLWTNAILVDPGSMIWSMKNPYLSFVDPSGEKHVGGRRRDTHTVDKVGTHGQTLLFYR